MCQSRTSLWLVADDRELRGLYASAFEAYDLPCQRLFASAEDLIEVLRKTSGPDLLLLDNGVPGICGAVAVKTIKPLSPSTLVFVISSPKNYCDVAEVVEVGGSGYFEKGDSFETMVKAMRLANSRSGRSIEE